MEQWRAKIRALAVDRAELIHHFIGGIQRVGGAINPRHMAFVDSMTTFYERASRGSFDDGLRHYYEFLTANGDDTFVDDHALKFFSEIFAVVVEDAYRDRQEPQVLALEDTRPPAPPPPTIPTGQALTLTRTKHEPIELLHSAGDPLLDVSSDQSATGEQPQDAGSPAVLAFDLSARESDDQPNRTPNTRSRNATSEGRGSARTTRDRSIPRVQSRALRCTHCNKDYKNENTYNRHLLRKHNRRAHPTDASRASNGRRH